jgi:hypothetical protein
MGESEMGESKAEKSETFPSLAEIDAIDACPHPVLRNLRITQAYHELSTATARKIGSAANWCTFATWASKQAGQPGLFRPPFTLEQLGMIAVGRTPDGPL